MSFEIPLIRGRIVSIGRERKCPFAIRKMALHGNSKEGREELDAQREMERLTAFVGIVADEPAEGQDSV